MSRYSRYGWYVAVGICALGVLWLAAATLGVYL